MTLRKKSPHACSGAAVPAVRSAWERSQTNPSAAARVESPILSSLRKTDRLDVPVLNDQALLLFPFEFGEDHTAAAHGCKLSRALAVRLGQAHFARVLLNLVDAQ